VAYRLRVQQQVVDDLQSILNDTRELVKAGTKSEADVVRLEPLVELARMNQARTEVELRGAWRQLAAEVGVPTLALPTRVEPLANNVPAWPAEVIQERVQAANTDLRVAQLEAERARIEWERARAEAVPNVTFGGGYVHSTIDHTDGAIVSLESAVPIWDRKQGLIHEARARWARAQAAHRTTAVRLHRDTAEAYARYDASRIQVEALTTKVLPRLEDSLARVRAGYKAGVKDITLADVQLAIESVNDARLRLAEGRRELWRAVADLEGLMQLDLGQEETLP
jgi:cobalt-zinc-cadmium efflux system outer membrane protein